MHDDDDESEHVTREKFRRRDGIMPVGADGPKKAASKKTRRDRRKNKWIGMARGGIRKRRLKG